MNRSAGVHAGFARPGVFTGVFALRGCDQQWLAATLERIASVAPRMSLRSSGRARAHARGRARGDPRAPARRRSRPGSTASGREPQPGPLARSLPPPGHHRRVPSRGPPRPSPGPSARASRRGRSRRPGAGAGAGAARPRAGTGVDGQPARRVGAQPALALTAGEARDQLVDTVTGQARRERGQLAGARGQLGVHAVDRGLVGLAPGPESQRRRRGQERPARHPGIPQPRAQRPSAGGRRGTRRAGPCHRPARNAPCRPHSAGPSRPGAPQ